MVVVFANNQVMITDAMASVTITTDPVPLNGNDRAAAILLVHYMFGGGGAGGRMLSYQMQVSNDGTTWVDQGPSEVSMILR